MFVTYVLNKISTTYRTFIFVLMTSLLSMSFISSENKAYTSEQEQIKKESPRKEEPTSKNFLLEKTTSNAVVPAVQLELQKVAILFRKILLDEITDLHTVAKRGIILPKLLQILLTTAIQNNAP